MTEENVNPEVETEEVEVKTHKAWKEEIKVKGEGLVSKIKEIVREGNVRHVTIQNEDGKTVLEFPLTLGVVGALLVDWCLQLDWRERARAVAAVALAVAVEAGRLFVGNGRAGIDQNLGHDPVARGQQGMLHLHGLQDDHRVTFLDAVADFLFIFDDHAGHGRQQQGSGG